MKKIALLLIAIIISFTSIACNDTKIKTNTNTSSIETTNNTSLGNEELPITTEEQTRTGWKIGEFVDEFKQPTGERYVYFITTTGTFSNSATTNSELTAAIQVTNNDVYIMLYEYGSMLVKGTFDLENYDITILDQYGKKHYLEGLSGKGMSKIFVTDSDVQEVLDILATPGIIRIYMEFSKYTVSTYLFEIDTNGFDDLYQQI